MRHSPHQPTYLGVAPALEIHSTAELQQGQSQAPLPDGIQAIRTRDGLDFIALCATHQRVSRRCTTREDAGLWLCPECATAFDKDTERYRYLRVVAELRAARFSGVRHGE
jgi:hypothetical protein